MRIRSWHCIRLLKGIWQILKRLGIFIKDKNCMIRGIRYLKVCCILHNSLIHEPWQPEWADDESSLNEDDEINTPLRREVDNERLN